MQFGERHQFVRTMAVMAMVAVLLVVAVSSVRADTQHQTVPTMPPPTKSPTVTPVVTATNAPGDTPVNPPANTATSPAQPSATYAEATGLPPTQTAEAEASATAELTSSPSAVLSATLQVATGSPAVNPIPTGAPGGNTVPQLGASEEPRSAATELAASVDGGGGISEVWLFGLILAGAVLMLVALLVRWVLARRKEQNGGNGG